MISTLRPHYQSMSAPLFTVAVLLAICSLPGFAKDRHLPLPPQVIAAKTIYIENRSGEAAMGDRAYQEITSWGRFQVVQDKSRADLILLLTARQENRGYVTSGGGQSGTVNENGNIETTPSPQYTRPNVAFYSGLAVLDAKTGDSLWTESKRAAAFRKSAIKRAIDELRKRMEEETAQPEKQ